MWKILVINYNYYDEEGDKDVENEKKERGAGILLTNT